MPYDGNAPPTPADVLRGAAIWLREHGWIQGALFDNQEDPTAACVVGAMGLQGDYLAQISAGLVLARHLGMLNAAGISAWNDEDGRTKEEVIAALEAAVEGCVEGCVEVENHIGRS